MSNAAMTAEQAKARQLIDAAPVEWARMVEGLTMSEAHEAAEELASIATRAAALHAYVEERAGLHGCGNRTHEDANREAKRAAKGVRKALGFSYPARGYLAEYGIPAGVPK